MRTNRLQRNSRQRQVILEELRKLTSHPTAAVLYAVVRRRLPKISLGTVYRNLELLARMGVVQKLELAGGEARFDGRSLGTTMCGACDAAGWTMFPPRRLTFSRGRRMIGAVIRSSAIDWSSSASVPSAEAGRDDLMPFSAPQRRLTISPKPR